MSFPRRHTGRTPGAAQSATNRRGWKGVMPSRLNSALRHSVRRGGRVLFTALLTVLLAALVRTGTTADPEALRFVILGDRTGEAQPGVYEHVWREAARENP